MAGAGAGGAGDATVAGLGGSGRDARGKRRKPLLQLGRAARGAFLRCVAQRARQVVEPVPAGGTVVFVNWHGCQSGATCTPSLRAEAMAIAPGIGGSDAARVAGETPAPEDS